MGTDVPTDVGSTETDEEGAAPERVKETCFYGSSDVCTYNNTIPETSAALSCCKTNTSSTFHDTMYLNFTHSVCQ